MIGYSGTSTHCEERGEMEETGEKGQREMERKKTRGRRRRKQSQ